MPKIRDNREIAADRKNLQEAVKSGDQNKMAEDLTLRFLFEYRYILKIR